METEGRRLAVTLGAAIGRMRRERGLTLEDLAARSELHRTTIGLAERGARHLTIASAAQIAAALGMPLSELISIAEDRSKGRGR